MTIVAVNGGGNTPQGDNDGDVDGRDFLVWQRGDSPSPSEIVVTKVTDVSSTLLFREGDTFNFQPELTSEPTAPEAGKHEGARDWIILESCQLGDPVTFTATVRVDLSAYEGETGAAVAMESLTYATEGFWL